MKTLVGVDLEGTYAGALGLCNRLRFPEQSWILANAIPPMVAYPPGLVPVAIPIAQTMEALNESGLRELHRAKQLIAEGEVVERVEDGTPAGALLKLAEANGVDLIVCGAARPREGLLWAAGSVSRALSFSARQSLLVTKMPVNGDGPLRVLLATDHSEYANRAVDQLLSWAPLGIERIDIVTAFEVSQATLAILKESTQVRVDFESWFEERVNCLSQALTKKLCPLGAEMRVHVAKGQAKDVIAETMHKTGADLLIVGAHGHGFVERLLVGSVSLHQVIAEPYPVLLIRVE